MSQAMYDSGGPSTAFGKPGHPQSPSPRPDFDEAATGHPQPIRTVSPPPPPARTSTRVPVSGSMRVRPCLSQPIPTGAASRLPSARHDASGYAVVPPVRLTAIPAPSRRSTGISWTVRRPRAGRRATRASRVTRRASRSAGRGAAGRARDVAHAVPVVDVLTRGCRQGRRYPARRGTRHTQGPRDHRRGPTPGSHLKSQVKKARAGWCGPGAPAPPRKGEARTPRETPLQSRFPRSERFCLGTLGGAGGTRTHGRRIMSPLL